jgi:hypothetical protein
MAHLQLEGAGNKLTAIPKAYGWLEGKHVNGGGHCKQDPSEEVVEEPEFHAWKIFMEV